MWWNAISAGLQLGGAIEGFLQAGRKADLLEQQTQEQVRRFRAQGEERLGEATLAGAASGIETDSGSLQRYLAGMSAEFTRQAGWMEYAGMQQAQATRDAGWWTGLHDIGAATFDFAKSENWFKTPQLEGAGK